jgi:electron transport complex protein RnfG
MFAENKIFQAWLVLSLALFFGAALAAVQIAVGPRIEANKTNETKSKVPELVGVPPELGKGLTVSPRSVSLQKSGKTVSYSVFSASMKGKPVGWVAKIAGQGYADKIELLVGFDPLLTTITGVFVLDQKETPGLGNKIITPEWRGQFTSKSTDNPLVVVKTGAGAANEINAITGATISSKSVTSMINSAVHDLKGPLTEEEKALPSKG